MNDHLNRNWFVAKDIKKLLDISSSQLFHWGRTWGLITPEIKAKGRAHKDKYSFQNILDLALIKELNKFGLEPGQIKDILVPFPDIPDTPEEWKGSIWNYFRVHREDMATFDYQVGDLIIPGFEKAGCLLLIYMLNNEYMAHIDNDDGVLNFIKKLFLERERKDVSNSFFVIDLFRIVRDLEKETGSRL